MTHKYGLIQRFTRQLKFMPAQLEKRAIIASAAILSGLFTLFFIMFFVSSSSQADASITIEKSPDVQSILPGNFAFFTITLTNTGDVTLSEFYVSDFKSSNCIRTPAFNPIPDLNPGESYSYVCSSPVLFEDLLNEASVTAGVTDTVSASDTALVHATHLEINKSPEVQSVNPGQTATFTITLENSGGFTLTELVVTDLLTPDCNATYTSTLPVLGPGDSYEYTCQTAPLSTDLENVLTATGVIEGGPMLTRGTYALVEIDSPLEVSISPDWETILTGERASFDITLRNTGSTQLVDVAVSDPGAPDCDRPVGSIPDLNAGESYAYSCHSPVLTGDLPNTVNASALDGGMLVSGSGFAYVDATPPIDITVEPAFQVVTANLTATFTITLTNSLANMELVDVSVVSPDAPDCSRPLGMLADLAPSEVISYTCQAATQPIMVLYDMTALASPYDGDQVFDIETVYAGPWVRYFPILLETGMP